MHLVVNEGKIRCWSLIGGRSVPPDADSGGGGSGRVPAMPVGYGSLEMPVKGVADILPDHVLNSPTY